MKERRQEAGPAPARFIVFDTETPNRRCDRMCSVGVCLVEEGRILGQAYALVDPEEPFEAFHVRLHGIGPRTVAGQPNFAALWKRLEPLFSSGVLVAHNAPFDMAVLARCLRDYGIRWKRQVPYACTCQMARACLRDVPDHKLQTLCRRLDIPLEHHNAASDSLACARLLLYCLEQGVDLGRYLRQYDMERIATLRRR